MWTHCRLRFYKKTAFHMLVKGGFLGLLDCAGNGYVVVKPPSITKLAPVA